jgi:hypothetical protein
MLGKPPKNNSYLVLLLVSFWFVSDLFVERAIVWPPNPDGDMAQTQSSELAVEDGEQFRGRSISMLGLETKGVPGWSTFAPALYDLLLTENNDLMVDARHAGIPVANEYGHWISPIGVSLLAVAFFDRYASIERTSQSPRFYRENLARLLGVALIVADSELAGLEQIMVGKFQNRNIYLYRVPSPNVGQFSPVEQVLVKDAHEMLNALRSPEFDGAQQFLTETPIQGRFLPARNVSVKFRNGPALSVVGESDELSILALPFEYSHCITASGDGLVQVFPVNLGQIGLLVRDSFSVEISYEFGLFSDFGCRGEDIDRLVRLDLDNAVTGHLFIDTTGSN